MPPKVSGWIGEWCTHASCAPRRHVISKVAPREALCWSPWHSLAVTGRPANDGQRAPEAQLRASEKPTLGKDGLVSTVLPVCERLEALGYPIPRTDGVATLVQSQVVLALAADHRNNAVP